MKLYFRECRRIATSFVYFLFIVVLVFSWWGKFRGVTKTEINSANGKTSEAVGFDRPLLAEPKKDDDYFGTKISEDNPEEIMTGVTRVLLMEYKKNVYAAYPLPLRNYKAVSLNGKEQARVLEILCEVTGLTEEQLNNLPKSYFPAVTGTIISTDRVDYDEEGNFHISGKDGKAAGSSEEIDKTKKFMSQVIYERFKELMHEMETTIGEEGSYYQAEMMMTYFGMSEMSYEEARAEYGQTIRGDKVTGGFARLFCDYMGLSLGLYPIFIIVFMWLKGRMDNMAELLYIRKVSSIKLVLTRYLAGISILLVIFSVWVLQQKRKEKINVANIYGKTLGNIKVSFRLSIQNNLLLAVLYLLIVPVLRVIENLNEVYSAECLEQSVIFVGILLIAPLHAAEQGAAIREVVFTRKIPQWMILLIRTIMAIIILVFLTGIFAGIMIMKNCTFSYMSYVIGTVISKLALGSVGCFTAVLSDSVIAGYLVSIGYFLFNYLGYISDTNVFWLFSMGTGDFKTKIWLLGISILLITITLTYVKKKKVC